MVLEDELLQREERDGLGSTEAYITITQEDVVEGVASFMALFLQFHKARYPGMAICFGSAKEKYTNLDNLRKSWWHRTIW